MNDEGRPAGRPCHNIAAADDSKAGGAHSKAEPERIGHVLLEVALELALDTPEPASHRWLVIRAEHGPRARARCMGGTEGRVTLVDLRAQPWWTPADQDELDLLTHEFVKAAHLHRQRCDHCRATSDWWPDLRDAFDAVSEWRDSRVLRSQAAWLRARQTLLEREIESCAA